MLVIKCVPKNEDSFIQMMQSLNDKKFRYFADLSQGQIISFGDDNTNVAFFRTVRSYCEILAVMNENFKDYPFVNNDMNCYYTNLTTKLIALEASNPVLAQQILGAFKEICENMISSATSDSVSSTSSVSSDSSETTDATQDKNTSSETTDGAKPEASPAKSEEVQPILRANVEEKATKKSEPVSFWDAIPEDVKRTMGEKELTLFPYVCEGLAAVNKLVAKKKEVSTSEKAQLFLTTIKFSTDAYILRMFSALEDISSVTYQNILTSKVYAKKRVLSNKEICDKIRNEFRCWATKTCPAAIEANHLLSFADILKIYKKFVE